MKKETLFLALRGIAFFVIFALLFSLLTHFFVPTRVADQQENGQIAGFYEEPAHTIDVLGLGSCNMYSSFSPVILYEKYGITCYSMCCPDEELSTSYHYLVDALKTQDIKAVVVESLFFLCGNTSKREYYNRLALDYMPLSVNKLELMLDLSEREPEHMKQYGAVPDRLLTFASYLLPLLRYHSRDDFHARDVKYFFQSVTYSSYKGGFPQYTYTRNDDNFFDQVLNGDALTEAAQEYVPMMKKLCDEKGIPMIVVKSPNYLRWGTDDSHTKIVRDFCEQLGIPFVDFHLPEYDNFEIWDYGDHTGRLNVYGMQKFSQTLGRYLTEEVGLKPTELSEKNRAKWDACVEKYYEKAEAKNCSLYPGHLAQLASLDGAVRVRWNVAEDCETYSVYRSDAANGSFRLLTDSASGETYEDADVVSGRTYSYYVVPNEGSLAGTQSPTLDVVYLDMPEGYAAENSNGVVSLTWNEVPAADRYILQRREGAKFAFEDLAEVEEPCFTDETAEEGTLYYYRLLAVCEADETTCYSMSQIQRTLPRSVPEITEVHAGDGITVQWTPAAESEQILLLRRSENEPDFRQIAALDGTETKYVDTDVEKNVEYFYKVTVCDEYLDYKVSSSFSNTVGARVIP